MSRKARQRAPPCARHIPSSAACGVTFPLGGEGLRTTDGRPYNKAVSEVHIRLCQFGRIIRSKTKESDVMGSAFSCRYVRTMPSPAATESGRAARSSASFGIFSCRSKKSTIKNRQGLHLAAFLFISSARTAVSSSKTRSARALGRRASRARCRCRSAPGNSQTSSGISPLNSPVFSPI